eukprot:SAG22_NODE_433_length_10557_cov_6.586728_2_plen_373_part_00
MDAKPVGLCARLLGLNESEYGKCLTNRKVKAGKDTVTTTLNAQQAATARDNFSKHVYSRLFDWIAEQINIGVKKSATGNKDTSIGVLDIFGFECFKINSFEQLCINFTNEKLQFHFNEHIFMLEMLIYKREQLDVKAISFKDNQGCLDLIEKRKTGVMAMISEEIYVPKGNDISMLEKLHKQVSHKALPFCCASTVFLSKTAPFRAVLLGRQNYGYNDFYSKPQLRGGRNASADQGPGPNEAFTIKVSWTKALSFCWTSTAFRSKPVPFHAVCPARPEALRRRRAVQGRRLPGEVQRPAAAGRGGAADGVVQLDGGLALPGRARHVDAEVRRPAADARREVCRADAGPVQHAELDLATLYQVRQAEQRQGES